MTSNTVATRRLRAALLVLSAALALGSSACQEERGDRARPTFSGDSVRREPTRVRTAPVEQREMVRLLTTTTNVESETEISIFPRSAGVVTEVRVEEGDAVTAGQVLAVLDQREAQVMLDEAKMGQREAQEAVPLLRLAREEAEERLARAKITWEQAQRDVERNERAGLISQQDLDRLKLTAEQAMLDHSAARLALDRAAEDERLSQTAIDKAELALQRQSLALDALEVRAPFEGVIASRSIRVGDTASSATPAFVLTDIERLRAIFFRPQRELPMFRAAQASMLSDGETTSPIEIRAEAEALPGVEFEGAIELVSPTIDAASGSFRITVRLPQDPDAGPGERLLPGMLVRLSIVTERHPDALVVPKRALRREAETSFLFKVVDGVAERIEVSPGFASDSDVEVSSIEPGSLSAGDAVVVIGNRDLEQGSEVTAEGWQDDAPAPAKSDDEPEVAAASSAGDAG